MSSLDHQRTESRDRGPLVGDDEQWAQRGEKRPLGKARRALPISLPGWRSDGRERGAARTGVPDRGAPLSLASVMGPLVRQWHGARPGHQR